MLALHEAPAMAIMAGAVIAGHAGLALAGSALGLAALSMGYARLARHRVWARDHVIDLWAMAAMMLGMLWAGSTAGVATSGANLFGSAAIVSDAHHHALAPLGAGAVIAVVVAWFGARSWSAFRSGIRTHSVLSAAVCGAGMLWMLVAHP